MSHNTISGEPRTGTMNNFSLFLTYTQYFLDTMAVFWYNRIIEIGGKRMRYTGRLIQLFTFVEDGRGPPRGKPETSLFSKPIYLVKISKLPSQNTSPALLSQCCPLLLTTQSYPPPSKPIPTPHSHRQSCPGVNRS